MTSANAQKINLSVGTSVKLVPVSSAESSKDLLIAESSKDLLIALADWIET